MFLHIAKTQKMGHDVEEKPGQLSRPSNWNYNDLSPFKEPDLLHAVSRETSCVHFRERARSWCSPAVSWQPEVTDLGWADKGCIKVQISPIPSPSTYPIHHRQTDLVSNTRFLLQSTVSHLTSTPSSTPDHNSSTGNSGGCYTTVGCLQHNTAIQFLEVGSSAIQKGKRKSEFLPRANIRSRRSVWSFARAFLKQGWVENVKIIPNKQAKQPWNTPSSQQFAGLSKHYYKPPQRSAHLRSSAVKGTIATPTHFIQFWRMAQFLQPIPVCRTSGIQLNRSFPTGSKSHIHSWTWKSQHKATGFRSKIWARVQDSYPLCLPLCSKVARLVLSPTTVTVTAIPSFRDMFKITSWPHTPIFFFFFGFTK